MAYVRNRSTGELSAFVAVTVAMESLENAAHSASDLLSNLHAGTAVFRFDRDHWVTDGRAILNLSPSEAIRFYQNDIEVVGQELAEQPWKAPSLAFPFFTFRLPPFYPPLCASASGY